MDASLPLRRRSGSRGAKHDACFPANAVNYCLGEARGAKLDELDAVVFYEKPFLKFERLLETYMSFAPRGFRQFLMAMPIWLREKLFQRSLLTSELKKIDAGFDPERLLFSEHHLSHAASAFFPSPFERAAVLTLDGVGEWTTTAAAIGDGKPHRAVKEMQFPHSLGLLYSAFTYYTGFKVNSGEYKLMGLAPYGKPGFVDKILEHLIDLKPDGSFRLDQTYFDYMTGFTMTNRRFAELFGEPVRDRGKSSDHVSHGYCGFHSGGHRRDRAAAHAIACCAKQENQSLSRRWRRPQLRR